MNSKQRDQLIRDLTAQVRAMRDDVQNIVNNWSTGDLAEAVNWAQGGIVSANKVIRRGERYGKAVQS